MFALYSALGGTTVWAQTINDPGGIVGVHVDADGVAHGFGATRDR